VVEAAGGPGSGAACLVPPGDPEALATALLRVEQDPAFRALLVERGRRRVSGFRWSGTARRLRDVLREAASGAVSDRGGAGR
jgi:glycosyltransferase involved in cell wall biosynthesis